MPAISTIIAAVAAGAGLALQQKGLKQQEAGIREQSAGQARIEKAQTKKAGIERTRSVRQQIRQAQIARAEALSTGSAQGAGFGSGIAGALGAIGSNTSFNLQGIGQGAEIGQEISAGSGQANQGAAEVAVGQGISSLGGALISNSGQIGRVGAFITGPKS